ncbi:facilitated trehalose transporter Tret1-2 homolog [Diorhabda sublineata]|uniref:facilitated trehalose transporter Tret1-2 homolog n=1 Tax=Diorhabda sublineata TaxID=1163346 RepID=UPI0024E07378|nr:facilitated trehalose transporter Tret1-2 homolog [Diorhabda sublineata]
MITKTLLSQHRVYQYIAAISGTICIMSSEMHFGWTSQSLPSLTDGTYKLQISKDEASWLAVILLAGTVMGAVIAGKLTDIVGRRKIILITSIPLIIGWIMIGAGNSNVELFVGRFIAGIANGLSFSTVPMYLAEIAEPEIRGIITSLCPVFVVLGILIINFLGSISSISTTAYIAMIFPSLCVITFHWMPESPSFLLQREKHEEARKILERLRAESDVEEELQRVMKFLGENKQCSWKEFFLDKVTWRAILIAYGLRTAQQFSGTTALTFYCKTIFDETDDIFPSELSTVVYFLLQLIVSSIAIFLVDVYGRKPLLLISTVGTTLTLFIMSAYLHLKNHVNITTSKLNYIPIVILFSNIIFFSIGLRTVPLLMMGEMFSPRFRAKGLCIGCIYFSVIAMVFAKTFFDISLKFGQAAPFLLFSVLSFISTFFVIFCIPETKGLTLEGIQRILKKLPKENNTQQQSDDKFTVIADV